MGGERSIMPSAARIRRGWRAGLRSRARWLDAAAATLAVGAVISSLPWSTAASWGPRWREAVVDPSRGSGLLEDLLRGAGALSVAVVLAVVAARLVVALMTGQLGAVSRRERERLDVSVVRWGWGVCTALAVLGIVAMTAALRGVVAGAARAVDASPRGLIELWSVWPSQLVVVLTIGLAALGGFELLVSRRRTVLALMQSPAELREDARARGGRRR